MKDQDKTKEELISELKEMRQRIAELEGSLVLLKQHEATPTLGMSTDSTERIREKDPVEAERQHFLSLLDALPAYLCLITPDYHVVFINRYFRERFGDPAGRRCYEFAFGLSEPCENCQASIVLETKTPNEYEWLGPDGHTYLVCDQLVHDIDGSPLILEMGIDITDRKKAEEDLHRVNREVQAIKNCNQAVLRAEDEQTLLSDICRIVCDEGGYRLAWVGYAENDDAKTIRPVAWAGFDSGYIADAKLSWADDTERGRGPAGKVIRTGERVYVQDFTTDPLMAPWRDSALQHGYRSGIALPLKDENTRVFGVLLIYHSESNVITADEIRLMEELADDLAFGINSLRNRVQRKRAEEALRASEERFRTVADWTYDWEYWVDPQGNLNYMSPSCKHVTGFTPEEFTDDPSLLSGIVHLADKETYEQHVQLIHGGGADAEEAMLEFRIVAFDGTVHWIEHICRPVHGVNGTYLGRRVSDRDITERKRAEEALKRANQEWERTFNAISDWIMVLDDQHKIVRANKAMADVLGKPERDLMGRLCYELVHGTECPPSFCPHSQLLTDGEEHSAEVVEPRLGSTLDVRVSPILDRDGHVRGSVHVAREITELKRVQLRLENERSHLRTLVETIPDLVWLKDPDGVYLTCNPRFERFFGAKQSDIVGKTDYDFVNADLADFFRDHDRKAMEAGKPSINQEWITFADDGHRELLETIKTPMYDSDGTLIGVLGIGRNITAGRNAEMALRESEQQYRTLFEDSIDGVYSVLRDGTITDANTAFCKLFGYTATEMIGKDIRELYLDPADRPKFQEAIEKTGFVKDYEIKFQKRNGTEVDCLLSSSVIFEEDGSITGYRGIVRDLTARKELHRQLQQAQKMEAVGTLAGGIAHDFNNILQVVLGYSELVLGDVDLPDRLRNDLERVLQAAKNGADLVQRLLTFSRKAEPKPLNLDLNQRIRQTQKFLERTIPKMIDIQMILADDLARIHADPTQMDQVLMNLAVNARDAMPDGGKLTIETANMSLDEEYAGTHLGAEPGEYVLLSVSDTGHGMDKETLDHIFEPFYTTKEAGKGTGLGLATVYGIVKQHGGQIHCYSEPGHGTTFKIYLPALAKEREQVETGTGEAPPKGGTETILLVDDEELLRDLGKRILERSGYTVLIAANGNEALNLYKRERGKTSLIILDLIMPEMGGKRCLEELLKIDPQVKVLMASGFAANGQTKEAVETGARGFISKPYNVKGMLQAVREVLDSE